MKTLLTVALIVAATQTHAQSNPGEPVWPVVGPIACKPGQVRFEGRCLTPDRQTPKRWLGEEALPKTLRDLLRMFCR